MKEQWRIQELTLGGGGMDFVKGGGRKSLIESVKG